MQLDKIALADTHAFSPFFLDYIEQKESLKPYYNRYPSLENFAGQIAEKSLFPAENREVIVSALQDQYDGFQLSPRVAENILLLKNKKTFTVTTGHQMNIFTGPLYFIYKIVTVINACKSLKLAYPEKNFIPVYWMASEDHDYDEIKYFRLYGKKYTWETDQKGAVGRFSTKGFDQLIAQLPGDVGIFRDAYLKSKNLSNAVRVYVNHFFGNEGLIVLDPDDRDLKVLFKNVMHEDVIKCSTLQLV